MIYFLLCVIFVLYCLHICMHSTEQAKLINKIPGAKLVPLIGNGLEFLSGPVPLFYKAREYANKYKNINRMWILKMPIVNVYDPEDIEIVLSSKNNIKKAFVYTFLHPWLKDGLLTSSGEKWQNRRKILTTSFHFNILRQFCTIFSEESDKMVEILKSEVGKSETDIQPLVTNFALNSICETAMGTNLDSDNSDVPGYKNSIYLMGELLVYCFTRPWLHSSFIFNMTPSGKKQKKALDILHGFTTKVIKERRQERNATGNKIEVENIFKDELISSKKRLAMLDLLLSSEADGKINEDGIREEVDTFMFEGHDTTTMAITFCLMLLANNQDEQERIVDELTEIFGDSKASATIDDLNNMKYTERCIKEALRIYPSVPFIARTIEEDVVLKNYTLPVGTSFNVHIYDVHHNPDIYPNPSKFDPDRFLPDNIAKRHPFAYIPFSAGPRNCIGQKFAILEEKAIISAILRNFKLEAVTKPDDVVFLADLVLRSRDPIKIKFIPRK